MMPSSSGPNTHYRTCPLCEAMCGLAIEAEKGKVLSIKGDREDPFSRGHICPKAAALSDIHEDPNRLRHPVKRNGSDWTPISWDEAIEKVADRLLAVRAAHGNDAFGVYVGNPTVHNLGLLTHLPPFLKLMKTKNRFSASSVDQLPHQLIAYWMYGHQFLVPIPDIDRTDYFLVLGANPLASNGSLMTVPDVGKRLKDLKKRGGKLVVIDPRHTETASVADEHHFIRPGTDAALLAAMLSTLIEKDLIQPGRLTALLDGFEQAMERIRSFTPERAAVTGIDASTIRRLARELAKSGRAACYGRMGVSTQAYGGLCQWLIQLINIATGNLDKPGGVLFTRPAFDMVGAPRTKAGHFDLWRSRVRGVPEFSGELPASCMAEEILTEGEGRIRAMMTVAGNPILSTPNGGQLERAFSGLDFMFSVDMYINETTRFADIILPPTSPLEHDHFDIIFQLFAVRNTVKYSPALFPKPESARHDWEILQSLANKIVEKQGGEPVASRPPAAILDRGLRTGPYGKGNGNRPALDLETLKAHPHGIDLGPLEPSLPDRLATEGKRIQCAPELLMNDLDRMDADLFGSDLPPLVLIGRRHLLSNNSWMHNYRRLLKGKDRCTLFMHPDDVAARGLADAQAVVVRSRTGEVHVPLQATERIMPGVVSLPHGWGHDRSGVRLDVAQAHPGVSINDLTDDQSIDRISGNAAVNGVPVTVNPCT